MIKLKSLITESKLTGDAKSDIDPSDAKKGFQLLYKFFKDRESLPWMLDFRWHLAKVRKTHSFIDGERYEFEYIPKKGKEINVKPYADASYTNKVKWFKTPESAVDYLEAGNKFGDDLVFRGMNMKEWIIAKKAGFIKSNVKYNIGNIDMTYYGDKWSTAHSYANSFAPFDKTATRSIPGVIVAIPKNLTKKASDVTGQKTDTEYVADKVPISQVKGIWFIVPTQYGKGIIELVLRNNHIDRGSAFPPSTRYAVIPKYGIAL